MGMANMTVSIRDAATDRLVRTLAARKNVGLTEAVRLAVANELRRLDEEMPLRERIAAIRRIIVARGRPETRPIRPSSTTSWASPDVLDARAILETNAGLRPHVSILSAAMKASCGMSTLPNCRIFFLPAFCFSRSLRLRVASPP